MIDQIYDQMYSKVVFNRGSYSVKMQLEGQEHLSRGYSNTCSPKQVSMCNNLKGDTAEKRVKAIAIVYVRHIGNSCQIWKDGTKGIPWLI